MAYSIVKKRRIRDRNLAACSAAFSAIAVSIYYSSNFDKKRQHTSRLSGKEWMKELLNGHPRRIRDNLGVSQESFYLLEDLLIKKSNLKSTRFMGTTEQLGIFLYAVVTDLSMRKLAERFQRSTETINRTYHKVMRYFLLPSLFESFVSLPTTSTPCSTRIEDDNNFFPFFIDCVGAIDGTHIPILPPTEERVPFRNRKGFLSQNVLAVCDFELRFTMVMSGWEGSVADSTLWLEAHRIGALNLPKEKYLLGDAGFANCDACLTPYRGVRYHLKEWTKVINKRPQNKEELFNLRHAKLRNVVERIFGVMKARFKILTHPRAFKLTAQAQIVAALCALHNILLSFKDEEELGVQSNQEEEEEEEEEIVQEIQGYIITSQESKRAAAKRDEIATAMWIEYQARKRR
jgi:hypothetical protein